MKTDVIKRITMASDEPDDVKQIAEKECVLQTLEESVEKLYEFRNHYFEHHPLEEANLKHDRLRENQESTLKLIKSHSEKAMRENRARYFYLLGRAHDVVSTHSIPAEEALAKAVKLDPKLVEAWNQLGECYWKKDNIAEAKNCFQGALLQHKNKISLRNLSMVVRQENGSNREEQVSNVEQGLDLAKQAVEMDANDGESWSILGNAYLSVFFAIQQNPRTLKLAMSAYHQAEKGSVAKNNPDLHYNKGVALKYEEEYSSALDEFSKACQLDPAWEAPRNKQKQLIDYLDNTVELIKSKGKLKVKKMQSLLQGINTKQLGPYEGGQFTSNSGQSVKLQYVQLADLKSGINNEVVVLGMVICNVWNDDSVPFTFCLMDKDKTVFAVTVYNLAMGKGVIIGDSVAIPEPYVGSVGFKHGNSVYSFSSIRVDNPLVLVVNGKKLGRDKLAGTQLSTFKMSH